MSAVNFRFESRGWRLPPLPTCKCLIEETLCTMLTSKISCQNQSAQSNVAEDEHAHILPKRPAPSATADHAEHQWWGMKDVLATETPLKISLTQLCIRKIV